MALVVEPLRLGAPVDAGVRFPHVHAAAGHAGHAGFPTSLQSAGQGADQTLRRLAGPFAGQLAYLLTDAVDDRGGGLARAGQRRQRGAHLLPIADAPRGAGLGVEALAGGAQLEELLAQPLVLGLAELVVAALHNLDAPNLRIVELDGGDDLLALLTALTARPLPPSWDTLRVYAPVRDEELLLELLATRAHLFTGLIELCLPLDSVSVAAADRAQALVPELTDPDDLPLRLGPELYLGE